MNIGQAVRASRLSRKLTQSELAKLAGVSRQAIVLLESDGGRIATLMAVQPHAPVRLRGLPPGNSFGERVRSARGARSVEAVAAAAGVAANTVRALEANGGTLRSLVRVVEQIAPDALVKPVLHKPKMWKTVHGKTNLHRDIADYYATPAPIVRLLLDHEEFEGSLLEPCVGQARVIETVLIERGYRDIHCFDLSELGEEQRDFFDISETYDAIITNPPFSRHVDFVLHAKSVARKKIALLLPLNYLTGKGRHLALWEDQSFALARVRVLNRGVSFLTDDPHADRIQPSQLYLGWFIWERGHSGPPTMAWLDSHALIERR